MIRLGYEIGTGAPVDIPSDRHTAVSGQTQLSGKTTTLEALVHRSKLRAVAFVTKRAENSFRDARPVSPYFRDSADWQFVSAILEAMLGERMKFERSWIIDACRGAEGLQDVLRSVKERLHGVKNEAYADYYRLSKKERKGKPKPKNEYRIKPAGGLNASVLTSLEAYLDIVIPQIERLPYTKRLELADGLNVMDLSEYSTELQSLVIRSVLEWVYERERNTVVIIPEAWEFIPQNRRSPVLLAAEELIRKGAAAGNFVWLDSQDIAAVHKNVLRSVGVWILGVQREKNEVARTLAHISGSPLPKPVEVMQLAKGQFFVSFGQRISKVYVQPFWVGDVHARAIARSEEKVESAERIWRESRGWGTNKRGSDAEETTQSTASESAIECGGSGSLSPSGDRGDAARSSHEGEKEDEAMWKERTEQAEAEVARLRAEVQKLNGLLLSPVTSPHLPDPAAATPAPQSNGEDPAMLVMVDSNRPELQVRIDRPVLEMDGDTIPGRIALLISEKYFTDPKQLTQVIGEFKRRGWVDAKAGAGILSRAISSIAEKGFLTIEDGGYQAVPGMKITVKES